jgi:hypothetical protein
MGSAALQSLVGPNARYRDHATGALEVIMTLVYTQRQPGHDHTAPASFGTLI